MSEAARTYFIHHSKLKNSTSFPHFAKTTRRSSLYHPKHSLRAAYAPSKISQARFCRQRETSKNSPNHSTLPLITAQLGHGLPRILYITAASFKFCATGSQSSCSKVVTSWLNQFLELGKATTFELALPLVPRLFAHPHFRRVYSQSRVLLPACAAGSSHHIFPFLHRFIVASARQSRWLPRPGPNPSRLSQTLRNYPPSPQSRRCRLRMRRRCFGGSS